MEEAWDYQTRCSHLRYGTIRTAPNPPIVQREPPMWEQGKGNKCQLSLFSYQNPIEASRKKEVLKLRNSVFGWEETVGKWSGGNRNSFGFIFLGFLGNQTRERD